MADPSKGKFRGNEAFENLSRVSRTAQEKEIERGLRLGLEAADSVEDRTIPLFSRGAMPPFAGIETFCGAPYCEDANEVGQYEAAFIGEPFDGGTVNRPGARFGPRAMRHCSGIYDGYSLDAGVDLQEMLDLCDLGDVYVMPANLEKSFDQCTKAIDHIVRAGVFPLICGGDHSLGFPNIRAIAPHIDGNVGIIHIDRHLDCEPYMLDERMAGSPWYWSIHDPNGSTHKHHAHMHDVGLPNVWAENFVQIGAGGWVGLRDSSDIMRRRGMQIMTIDDMEELGPIKAAEIALEIAWKGAKAVYLSYDIDSIDPAFAPGTQAPEPGGILPREAIKLVRTIAREGLCGMEVVEISPPYDVNDNTALLGNRLMLEALGAMVANDKLGHRERVTNSA